MWFLILSDPSLRYTNSEESDVLIDLWNTTGTNYLVLSATHGNMRPPSLPPSLSVQKAFRDAAEKGGCNHRTPRGDGARKRGLRSQWLSVASSFSLATGSPSDGITFFVIPVTCISLLTPSSQLGGLPRLFLSHLHAVTPEKLPSRRSLIQADQYLINSVFWI